MRIISRRTLLAYVESLKGDKDQSAVQSALDAWFKEVSHALWSSSADVKKLYATASIVSADRVVFNIKGNDHRLVVAINYKKGLVWIIWIGSHAAYDRIDVRTVRHGS
jgi:mRNA interferase HigB